MDTVNSISKKEYLKKYIESWQKDLDDYKNKKASIVNEYVQNERMFNYIPKTKRKQVIEEHVELLISQVEKKINEIKQEIE